MRAALNRLFASLALLVFMLDSRIKRFFAKNIAIRMLILIGFVLPPIFSYLKSISLRA